MSSTYRDHAMNEFRAAGWLNDDGEFKDEMQKQICEHVLDLLDTFDGEDHSGSSAHYAVGLFGKLALFEPISPITGEDWEWVEVSDNMFQNRRCSHVFKTPSRFDGQAYDIQGKIFREPDGACYTSADSCVPVTFPYKPKSEYVDVPFSEESERMRQENDKPREVEEITSDQSDAPDAAA